MVHPSYRRKGIFKRLFNLAKEECRRRNYKKILLVCDNRSYSGLAFITATGTVYAFSEYEMRMVNKCVFQEEKSIILRKALNSDADEIAKQNYIYFGNTSGIAIMPEDSEKADIITYMIELDSQIIGKILFGDLKGLPPILIYVGGDETLRDDSILFAEKAKKAGVDVTLRVGEGLFHCYPAMSPMFPEAKKAMKEICDFINKHIQD